MKKLLLLMLCLGYTIFSTQTLQAQCSGIIALSNQTQVNALMCTEIDGTLIIEDDNDGVDNITSINILWQNGLKSGALVTGDLIVRNCNSLNSAQGIDGIGTIQGNMIIENNEIMGSLGYITEIDDVQGNIIIRNNPNISIVDIFPQLVTVGGDIIIENNNLCTVVINFDDVISVGGKIRIKDNPALNSFNAFAAITSVGSSIDFDNNDALATFSGFSNLTTAASIFIQNNQALTVIDGFTSLTTLTGTITITSNENLTSIEDFNSVTTLNNTFIFDNENLVNINAYDALTTVDAIDISNNPSLTTIPEFSNVTSITGNFLLQSNGLTELPTFSSFTSIGGALTLFNLDISTFESFPNLLSIGDFLSLTSHSNLTSVTGFSSLSSIGGNLMVQSNASLSDCCWVLPIIDITGGTITIASNATGCDSQAAIGGQPPVIACLPDFSVDVAAGSCIGQVTVTDPTPTDDCDALGSYSLTLVDGNGNLVYDGATATAGFEETLPLPVGINTYTYTILDEQGNSATCQTIVTVEDNISPEITCSSNITLDVDAGTCSATSTVEIPTPTDNCSIDNYTVTLVDGNGTVLLDGPASPGTNDTRALPAGINTYTFTAVDPGGLTTSCEIIVTVVDNIVPTITCEADRTVNVDAGSCLAAVTTIDPTPIDNCTITSYTLSLVDANGTLVYDNVTATSGLSETLNLPVGENTYTYTATDAAGNSVTCETIITVEDNTAPTWTDSDNTITFTGECGIDDPLTIFNNNMPIAIDNCITLSTSLTETEIIPLCGGTEQHIFTMIATDASGNNSLPYTLIVNLEDNTPAILSPFPSDVTIACNDVIPSPPAITASDQCAGDVTSNIQITESSVFGNCEVGTTQEVRTFTYTVDDGCGNITTDTWSLTIQNNFVVDLGEDISVCDQPSSVLNAGPGTSFLWSTGESTQTITVNNSGTYTVDVVSLNGCCESDEIEVFFDSAPDASASGAQLDCTGSAVQIMGESTTSNVSFSWTGPGGYTSTEQNPSVSAVGTYTLSVITPSGCISTADAEVTANTDVPDLTATGGTLTCTVGTVMLTSNSTVDGVSYSWTGPNGFMSTEQNPSASTPGTYIITITSPNSCVSSATVVVDEDTVLPTATLSSGILTCSETSTQIMANLPSDLESFSWTGPNGFTSSDENPLVTEVGTYTLSIVAENTCSASFDIEVTGDFAAPNASAEGGTLNCTASQVLLSGNSTTANVSYSWVGPNGFTSNNQNPQVTDLGIYTLTVLAQNGCSSTATAEVIADADLPQVSGMGGTIDCNNSTIQLMGTTTTNGVTLSWTGPDGFVSNDDNPIVSEPGVYIITALSSNGCSATQNVIVEDDTAQPEVEFNIGDVDCDAGIRLLIAELNVLGATVAWEGPNGFTSENLAINISDAGTYTLETFPPNGCNSTHTFELDSDITYTQEITTVDITDVNPVGSATIEITGGTGPFTIVWDNGETGETAVDLTAGNHTVTVTDGLGCVKVFDLFIDEIVATFEAEWINEINLYPNPVSNQLNIELPEGINLFTSIGLFDTDGKLVKEIALGKESDNVKVDVSTWNAGVYFAKINSYNASHSVKFIVLK